MEYDLFRSSLISINNHLNKSTEASSSEAVATFHKFIDLSFRSLGSPSPAGWSTAIVGYERALPHLQQALGELLYASEQLPYQDLLGALYMERRRMDRDRAQFFTPWPVAKLMASVQLVALDLSQYGPEYPLHVLDPACGSGTLLLAVASEVPTSLIWTSSLRLAGVDVDPLCVAMTRLNMRLHGLEPITAFVESRLPPDQPPEPESRLVLRPVAPR